MIVLDASVGLPLVAGGPGSAPLWERVSGPGTTLHVPHRFDVEVLHGLRRYALPPTPEN